MNLGAIRDHLRDLERKEKLEKQLAPNDDGLPWADLVWLLQVPAWLGLGIHIYRLATTAMETKQSVPKDEFAWLVLLALVAVVLKFVPPLFRTREQRLRCRVRRTGAFVPAAIVQANSNWYAEGNDRWQPGAVLVSLDPAAMAQPERLAAVAHRVAQWKTQDRRGMAPAQAAVAWQLYHEMGMLPAVAVPPESCDGLRDCLLFSTLLPPSPLRAGPALLGLVVAGETAPEALAMIPEQVAHG